MVAQTAVETLSPVNDCTFLLFSFIVASMRCLLLTFWCYLCFLYLQDRCPLSKVFWVRVCLVDSSRLLLLLLYFWVLLVSNVDSVVVVVFFVNDKDFFTRTIKIRHSRRNNGFPISRGSSRICGTKSPMKIYKPLFSFDPLQSSFPLQQP